MKRPSRTELIRAHLHKRGLEHKRLDARRTRELASLNTGRGDVYVYRKADINVHPRAHFEIDGTLDFGVVWPRYTAFDSMLKVDEDARVRIRGAFSIFTGARVDVTKGAVLEIGSGYINHDVRLTCFGAITMGESVAIADGVTIRDTDNHTVFYDNGTVSDGKPKPIVIEDRVWIGLNATILKGVRIGEGSIIGAGSVVNRDIPANCLAAGVPARVVRRNVRWGKPDR